MSASTKRVVLGVGARARKYDLDFPRLKAVYVDADEAPRLARLYPVAGVVVTGESLDEVVTCVRALRAEIDGTACIAVIDPRFLCAAEELREAGATMCCASWMGVQASFADEVRQAEIAIDPVRPPRRLH